MTARKTTVVLIVLFFLGYLFLLHCSPGEDGKYWLGWIVGAIGVLLLLDLFSQLFRLIQNFLRDKLVVGIGNLLTLLGLVIMVIGATYSYVYNFEGHFRLTEGESILDVDKSYQGLRKGFIRPNPEYRWAIQLEKVSLRYSWDGNILETAADLILYDQTENKLFAGTTGFGHPLEVGELQIHPTKLGVSPGLDLRDSEGNLIWRGAPKFDVLDKQGQKTDLFQPADLDLKYTVSFAPAARYVRGRIVNSSLTPTNPVFVFTSPDGSVSKPVPVGGGPVDLGGYSVEIPVFRYWVEFEVQSRAGNTLLSIGLAIIILGILFTILPASKSTREVPK
ncbi:MAG: cytochrome c biogenesis protein ResB [Firmicutes bacterium]|nr:cytochrome c biogenesis protein ResB [Bacillota bacterium]